MIPQDPVILEMKETVVPLVTSTQQINIRIIEYTIPSNNNDCYAYSPHNSYSRSKYLTNLKSL